MSQTLETLRAYIDRGRHAYRNRAIGLYVAALVVLTITIAVTGHDFYRAGPIVLVGILAIAGLGFHLWYRSLHWDRNRVLVALATEPAAVVLAQVLRAEGRAARLDERQVEIRTADAAILLTMKCHELDALGEALVAHCPSCKTIGFESPSA